MIPLTVSTADPFARECLLAGYALGCLCGAYAGDRLALLAARNPLGWVIRAYGRLVADIGYLVRTGQLRVRPGRRDWR